MRRATRDSFSRATAIVMIAALLAAPVMAAPISINATGSYSQDFNTLLSTGTGTWANDSTLTGWWAQRTGSGTSIAADAGSGNGGNLYSYGSTSSTDRALGSIGSSNAAAGNFAWGVQFQNTGTGTATLGTLQYTGEQWRNGGNTTPNVITMWYAVGSTPFTTVNPGTNNTGWTALTALDFSSPINTTTAAALDGNATANRTARSSNLGLTLNAGQYVMFRWSDPDHTGTDHGLAVDDFQLGWTYNSPTAGAAIYWDANGTAAGIGGTGTWSAASGLFSSAEAGIDATTRNVGDAVTFGGTAGTVTVTDTVNANAGLTFSTSGYTVSGGTVSLGGANLAANTINAATGSPTTITSVIAGSTGMTKAGAGTLVLDAANTFAGGINVNTGTLEINSDGDLGDVTNDLTINGSLRSTAGVALDAGRDLSGSGTLDIAAGTTLTVNGNANFSALTLANSGTLSLQGATRTAGVLTINSPLRVEAAGGISLSGLTAPALTSGTATVVPAIAFTGTGDRTVNVPGSGALVLAGNVSGLGSGRIAKTGSGTLSVGGSVDAGGFRLGSTGTTPVEGGSLVFGQAASAGTATLQLNYGTLSTTAAGGLTTSVGLSIGGRSGAAAVIGGSEPITFNGQSSFFRGSGTSGELRLNVNNTTTLAGGFAATSGSGTATGITVGGTGTLVLGGDGAALVDTITTADSVRLTLGSTSVLGGGVTVGATNVLNGSGRLAGAIAGAGSVQPGTSSGPGILTAGQLNPAAGTNFVLKFTGAAPNYASATASVNDVVRVTGATPLTAAMTSASDIDLFFGVTTISAGNSFEGGFFTDTAADFASLIAPATVNYYVLGNGAGTDATLAGQGYYSFANWKTSSGADPLLSLNLATTARTGNFTGADVNGQAMIVTAVPEPSATILGLAAAGLLAVGLFRRRSTGERHPTAAG